MKQLSFLLILCCFFSKAQVNTTLIGNLPYDQELSDIWGYKDETGIEYALVGVYDDFSVVSLEDPANPVEIFSAPGVETIWRDIKVWNDHAYITNEGGDGLLIVDLSPLPQSNQLEYHYFEDGWTTAHNLYIDENGVCYIFGANKDEGGTIMYDLTQDPDNPVLLGSVEWWYAHDGMARGDTLYMGNVNDGFFSIVDVSDKANPVLLGTKNTSFDFTHNVWVSDDGNYLYTTDEKSAAFIGAYDISDLDNIEHLDDWQSSPGEGVIPHNTHFINEYLVTSYYADGLSVLDATYPYNLIDVANYDESVDYSGNGFNGAWGAYPWLPSGLVLITDIEEGLFVFDVNYQRGCYLEGTVTETGSGMVLSGVNVEIENININASTSIIGKYATGYHTSGTYNVTYSKAGYFPETVSVTLENGVLVLQDVSLGLKSHVSIDGNVKEDGQNVNIENANILISSEDFMYSTTTNENGNFSLDTVFVGTYDIHVAAWGYLAHCGEITIDTINSTTFSYELEVGYADDFTTDLGWTISAGDMNGKGIWERVVPIGTVVDGFQAAPNEDIDTDCEGFAFVTGQTTNPSDIGADDLDPTTGVVTITSPVMDLTTYADPYVNYAKWFYNFAWTGMARDTLRFGFLNGVDSVIIDLAYTDNTPLEEWSFESIKIADYITITNSMQFFVTTEDETANHLVEAGFDGFSISEGTDDVSKLSFKEFQIYPNPSTGNQTIFLKQNFKSVVIINAAGQKVASGFGVSQIALTNLPDGLYIFQLEDEYGFIGYAKLLITN